MPIKQISSGGGEFTLAVPASASNRTVTLPDATTTLVGTDATQTLTNKTLGATDFTGDARVISSTAIIGYGAGAGSTVTQATSKATAVTINTPTGQITTNNALLAAGATVSFQVNCSVFSTVDVAVCVVFNNLNYRVWATTSNTNGIFFISLQNISAGNLSEAVVINYAIINGANA